METHESLDEGQVASPALSEVTGALASGCRLCSGSWARTPGPCPRPAPLPCLQVSLPVRLPALGLGVLQLQQGLDGPRTLPSSVRVYLHGRPLSVSRNEAFPLRVIDSGTSDFTLSNRYMQVWFSGLTGLLKVKGQGLGAGAGHSSCLWPVNAATCLAVDLGVGRVGP